MDIEHISSKYKGRIAYCVYFLSKGNDVVYVGSSRQILTRISAHISGDMDFDGVSVKEYKTARAMYNAESEAIVRLNPKHNICLPVNNSYKKATDCISDAQSVISELVGELPICFSRRRSSYIKDSVYREFIDSIEMFAEEKEQEKQRPPQVFILSSGELTPFVLSIYPNTQDAEQGWRVIVKDNGEIKLLEPGASDDA